MTRPIVSISDKSGLAFITLVLAGAAAGACGRDQSTAVAQFDVQTLARRLETPWAMAFAPDGRLFVTERPGRIRIIDHDSLVTAPWAIVPVHESAAHGLESGLMGLAIDPRFEENRRIFVCFTQGSGGATSNNIASLVEENGKGTQLRVILSGIPAGSYHNGCRLKFGPDGRLYATTGDATSTPAEAGAAQSLASLAGKVLRLNVDGSVPTDNPFPGSYIWSLGHRNPQGLAFQPGTGALFATEHGTGEGGNNELNVIRRGGNYGWPAVIGDTGNALFTRPIFVGPDPPAGATFVSGARYPELSGALLFVTLGTQRLVSVVFEPGSTNLLRTDALIEGDYGRLRDVVQGPDGLIYIATSNRDGRGEPVDEDDRVLRLVPRQ